MDKKLISVLVCPLCKGELDFQEEALELVCYADGLAYPIKDEIPVMLVDQARKLSSEEKVDRGQGA